MNRVSNNSLLNACLGNLLEHYDTALFSFLSPFLAPLIFPKHDPIVALILTYALIPLGMLVRPLGSLVFGFIGDAFGRRQALFLSLTGMAIVSTCIAFSPTYLQVGLLSPIIFCIGRVLQNFLAAGESMGGAIFLLENSSPKHHDFLSSIYNSSTLGGYLLASLGVFTIGYYNVTDPGWRVLYLFGSLTALFGSFMRITPLTKLSPITFSETLDRLKNVVWTYRKPLFFIIVSSGFAYATYTIALVLMNGFVPLISGHTKTEIMKVNTYLILLDLCALPFFGWLASKVSREKLMIGACLAVLFFAIPLFKSLEGASLTTVILLRCSFVILGVAFFAPFHAWAAGLIPNNCRYGVISLGYAIGSQLLGSPTAALSLWCFQKTGKISSVAWYWMALAAMTALTLWFTMRQKERFQIGELLHE